jgi:hypothetical protein
MGLVLGDLSDPRLGNRWPLKDWKLFHAAKPFSEAETHHGNAQRVR